MTGIRCQQCQAEYPPSGLPFICPTCGGNWDQVGFPDIDLAAVDPLPGVWRYQHTFDLGGNKPPVTLGEGKTPFVEDRYLGRQIFFKLENLNPTGSYKDRATVVLVNHMVERGISTAVEDSSGNAGASFAAYAARAGIHSKVYIPASASGPKRRQIEMYGAELLAIEGPRSAAALAVRKAADEGTPYASHAYLPFGMDGIATIAYEIFESLGAAPGTVIAPVGHGSFLLGIARGFKALQAKEYIKKTPVLVGVQAAACAPIAAEWQGLKGNFSEEVTVAEGVRVRNPVRGTALLEQVKSSGGVIQAISEGSILPARDELAGRGFYVEPTSAIVWAAYRQLADGLPDPVVLMLSGTGFKYARD